METSLTLPFLSHPIEPVKKSGWLFLQIPSKAGHLHTLQDFLLGTRLCYLPGFPLTLPPPSSVASLCSLFSRLPSCHGGHLTLQLMSILWPKPPGSTMPSMGAHQLHDWGGTLCSLHLLDLPTLRTCSCPSNHTGLLVPGGQQPGLFAP